MCLTEAEDPEKEEEYLKVCERLEFQEAEKREQDIIIAELEEEREV